MATGARAGARRGPVGEKKSEGGNASSSPSYIQVAPPSPPIAGFLCRFALLLCKKPLHITMFVLCYWQGTAAQQLAKAVQTKWVRPPNWCSGERPKDGASTLARGAGQHTGARAVIVYNLRAVTHFLRTRTISAARTHARTPHHASTGSPSAHPPHSAHSLRTLRTHRTTVATLVHPTSYARTALTHAQGTHCTARFSLLILSFLLRTYQQALVSPLSVQP
jgi:hypothetical protein